MGRQRTAIVEGDPRSHEEAIAEPVGRYPHGARGKTIQGIRLVLGARHQARECQLHALGRVALEDEAIERIERDDVLVENPGSGNIRKYATLRSVRIDVIELLEVGGILEIPKGRDAVSLRTFRRFGP